MTYLVYKHTSPSGKSYIGLTNDYERRNRRHRWSNACPRFHAAIKKYGWDNFLHEILYDGLTAEQAMWREKQAIATYGSMTPSGYNLTSGGENPVMSAELLSRLSRFTGRKHTEATKLKMSRAHTGRKQSAKSVEQRAAKRRGVSGKPHSIQSRLQRSKSFFITDPTGFVYHITGLKLFCQEHGLTYENMSRVASGKRWHHMGWVVFRV